MMKRGIFGHQTVIDPSTQPLPWSVGASKFPWHEQAHPQPALQSPVPRLALNVDVDLLGQELAELH